MADHTDDFGLPIIGLRASFSMAESAFGTPKPRPPKGRPGMSGTKPIKPGISIVGEFGNGGKGKPSPLKA